MKVRTSTIGCFSNMTSYIKELRVSDDCVYIVDRSSRLGAGSYGEVYLGTRKSDGIKIAAKQSRSGAQESWRSEVKNLLHVQHEHVVTALNFKMEHASWWLFMEYCDGGDLNKFCERSYPDRKGQLTIMYQCTSALNYMHNEVDPPLVHRDIKPNNILMMTRGHEVIAKIADFGLAKIFDCNGEGSTHLFTTNCGTDAFKAPELFASAADGWTRAVDVFSLGLVFFSLTQQRQPPRVPLYPLEGAH